MGLMTMPEKLGITHIEAAISNRDVSKGFFIGRVTEVRHPEIKAIFVLENREEAARFAAEKILDLVELVSKP